MIQISKVRAKFRVNHITDYGPGIQVNMSAVYSSDPNHENKAFSDATPSGTITIGINKDKAAAKFFEPGEEIYVDFTKAE